MKQTRAEIDLAALESNYNLLKSLIKYNVRVAAVVKADAYGHGIVGISQKLENLGVQMFCVAYTQEAIALRSNQINSPILLIAPFSTSDLDDIVKFGLIPTVYDFQTLECLNSFASKKNIKIPFHLKIDTGMNRLGFKQTELKKVISSLEEARNLNLEGISSHFFESDNPDQHNTKEQLKILKTFAATTEKALRLKTLWHMANSSAICTDADYHLDMVRPGLLLYGYTLSKNAKINGSLKPVLSLKSCISTIKDVMPGEFLGYNRSLEADKSYRIGIVPIGYADGYLKKYAEKGSLLVKAKRSRILGSICMDMLFCDITNMPDVSVGDEVTLIGRDGNEKIDAIDLANSCGTIPYEILTSISRRVPRIFIDKTKI